MQLGNGKWESTVFNSRLQPTQIALGTVQSATDKLKLNFNYGGTTNNGNVMSQTITVPTEVRNNITYNGFTANQGYVYDSLNRIKQATETVSGQSGNNWQQTFDYDRYGNRTFDELNTTTLPKNCVNGNQQAVVCANMVAQVNPSANTGNNRLNGYTFDNSGNTILDAQSRKFTYDGENKQVKVETVNGGGDVTATHGIYFYDGDGKRVKKIGYENNQIKEITNFVYDAGGKMVAEYSTLPNPTPQVSYLTSDHLGSPRINTDENGKVIARHDFQPFGEEIQRPSYGADDVRQKFTSYERDNETDLDFAQARYYKSTHGRFTTIDPAVESMKVEMPQSWNRFTYALNNPILFIDPSGELWINTGENKWEWVDKCPNGGTCYVALAVPEKNKSVTIYGSTGSSDISSIAANKNGVIDLNKLVAHHDANFIVAKDQTIPEEFLSSIGAAALFNVAHLYGEKWQNDKKLQFTAGAEASGNGCVYSNGKSCHRTHDGGNAIDVRYMDKNGNPIVKDNKAYEKADIERTTDLIKLFDAAGFNTIYTGKQSRFGLDERPQAEGIHRNHLHAARGGTPTVRKDYNRVKL